MTLRRGTHKTPRSLRPFPLFLIQQFFVLHFTFGTFLLSQSSVSQQRATSRNIWPSQSRKLLSSLPHGPVVWTYRLTSIYELQFQEPFEWPFPVFHVHPGSLILQMGKHKRPVSGFFSFSLVLSLDDSSCAFFMLR